MGPSRPIRGRAHFILEIQAVQANNIAAQAVQAMPIPAPVPLGPSLCAGEPQAGMYDVTADIACSSAAFFQSVARQRLRDKAHQLRVVWNSRNGPPRVEQ